jgi:N-acetylglutamate synthase-like GNAT family acetyltransferase
VFFLAELGINNPKYYSAIRGELNLWINETKNLEIKKVTRKNLTALNENFRKFIERNSKVEGFNWEKVLQFDKNISTNLAKTLKKIISESSVICESIFIFSKGDLIQLKDILEDGIWCTLIGEGHGKYVIRVLAQLKDKKAYNFVINVNHALNKARFTLETNWLIMLNADHHSNKLVEDFGSFWPEHKTFSEEYISNETVFQYLTRKQREISSKEFQDRWQMRWLHFIWNSVAAYLEFWKRSGQTRMIKDSSTQNLIIPQFDYYTGTRLISISGRSKATELSDVLTTLYKKLILDTEDQFPGLIKMAEWEILFTVVLEIFGTTKGFRLLDNLKNENQGLGLTKKRVNLFIKDVKEFGLLRKQVVFASLRYQRWLDLNNNATYEARGEIILDLYKDYNLQSLIEKYPETRLRFFLMTVFKDSNDNLKNKLNQLMIQMRSGSITDDILETYLHQIHEEIELTKAEKYFLTRLVFEHVDAADYAELITRDIGDKGLLELAINTKDSTGKLFTIRPAFHPKEIARFHRLLLEAKLDVQFESDHQFLLTFDQKNNLVGGVFWKKTSHGIAHLEKIAISNDFQKKNLSIKLIEELYQRLRIKKYKYLTVGFFKSELFYKVGFEINQKFGGLVKHL